MNMIKIPAMSPFARSLAPCCTLMAAVSCGGAPPAPPTPPPAPPPTAAAPTVVAADVSDAPEPTHLVGILRWKSPQATLDTVNRWIGMRFTGSTLAAEVLDKGLADTLAYDAPVDAVVALDPKSNDFTPLSAVSIGVRSLDEARRAAQAMGAVTEVRPGEYKVTLRHGKRKSDKPFCILRSAAGMAPARFVCANREREVNALSGYMTHSLPTRDLGTSDLHIELHAPPAMQLYGTLLTGLMRSGTIASRSKLEIGEPAFDRAIDAAASGVSEELIALANDLDTLTVDASVAPDHMNASFALRMKGQQSWTSGTLANQGARAAEPPPIFWHLPANSSMASYRYQPDAHRFDTIRHTLSDLLDGWLAHEGMALADRAPLTALLADKYSSDSPWVSASGPYATAEPTASKKGTQGDVLQAAVDGSGWYMVGMAAPNQLADALKTLANGINRPKIQAFVRDKLADLDKTKEAAAKAAKPGGQAVTLKSTPAPKELPKGSLDFELTVSREALDSPPHDGPKAKAPSLAPIKLHLLVVPEAAQTWAALGGDRAQLVKTVLAATEGAPESGTIAGRQDLGPLKNGKFVAGSFMTLDSFMHSWFNVVAVKDDAFAKTLQQTRSMLSSTPNKGKAPLFLTTEASPGDGMTYTMRLDVPKGYIEDLIMLIASASMSALARP
jgi:hypothetical protein